MRVFKKVTAIAAALALLGGTVLADSTHYTYTTATVTSSSPSIAIAHQPLTDYQQRTEFTLYVPSYPWTHSSYRSTVSRPSLTITAGAQTTEPTSRSSYTFQLDNHTATILSHLLNSKLLLAILPDGIDWELDQPFIESLLSYASTKDINSVVPTKLLLGDFERTEEIYELLSTDHTNLGDLSQLEYELDALKSEYDYQIQKLLTTPWQTQKCHLAAHPLIENPVLGSYSAVQIMACFPDCTLVPKNVKITFGLSLTGDEQKEIPPCIQANHAIIHIRQLRGANEFGYFYVDVEGNDQENPVRPFTIRKNIPKKVLRYLQARF